MPLFARVLRAPWGLELRALRLGPEGPTSPEALTCVVRVHLHSVWVPSLRLGGSCYPHRKSSPAPRAPVFFYVHPTVFFWETQETTVFLFLAERNPHREPGVASLPLFFSLLCVCVFAGNPSHNHILSFQPAWLILCLFLV